MAGNFKKILIILLILTSCNKKVKMSDDNIGKIIISQNINILVDSLDYFDVSKILVRTKNRVKNNNVLPFKVCVLDTIKTNFQDINLNELELRRKFNFKKKINVINLSIYSVEKEIKKWKYELYFKSKIESKLNLLNIEIFNLLIDDEKKYSCVTVKKTMGISMRKDIYFFKNINDKWIFQSKKMLVRG